MKVIITAPKPEDLNGLACGTLENWRKSFGWTAKEITTEFNAEHTRVEFTIIDAGIRNIIVARFNSYKSKATRKFLEKSRGVKYELKD